MASYIDSVLIEQERVLHRAHVSLWPYFFWIVLGIATAVIGVGLVILIWVWIKTRATEIAITNKRVIAKFGVISRQTIEINLNRVESIQVNQGVVARLFDFGTIVISGAGNLIAPISRVAKPLEFRRQFMAASDRTDQRQEETRR